MACVPQSGSRVRQSAAEWIRDRLRAGPWAKVPDNGCGQYLLHRALEVLVSGSRGSVLVRWEATWEAFRGCFHHFGSRTQGRVHGWSWSELNRASSAGPEQRGRAGGRMEDLPQVPSETRQWVRPGTRIDGMYREASIEQRRRAFPEGWRTTASFVMNN